MLLTTTNSCLETPAGWGFLHSSETFVGNLCTRQQKTFFLMELTWLVLPGTPLQSLLRLENGSCFSSTRLMDPLFCRSIQHCSIRTILSHLCLPASLVDKSVDFFFLSSSKLSHKELFFLTGTSSSSSLTTVVLLVAESPSVIVCIMESSNLLTRTNAVLVIKLGV